MNKELFAIIISSIFILVLICIIRFSLAAKKYRKLKNLRKPNITEYDPYLNELRKTIKDKGQLVKVMSYDDNFILDSIQGYRKCLGAVPISNAHGNYSNVYVAYEDYDGSIKYYDYPLK